MEARHLVRQSDLIPTAVLGTPITILGAGAVGSFTALALAKMGFGDLRVWDPDTVDEVNAAGQLYGPTVEDVGTGKVAALCHYLELLAGLRVPLDARHTIPWEPGCPLSHIVICAVDSMEVRQQVWAQADAAPHLTKLVIDPRMAIEHIMVLAAQPGDENTKYPASLYSDADAIQERCTAKSTAYTSLLIAGLVAQTVKGFLVDGNWAKSTKWSLQPAGQMERWGKDGVRW